MARRCFLCNKKRDKINNIALHSFPEDERICKKWMDACGLASGEIVKYVRICSNHFNLSHRTKVNGRLRLLKNAVPSVNITNKKHPKISATTTEEQLQKRSEEVRPKFKFLSTEQETQVLLETICITVKDQPECFEKPTRQIFYNNIKRNVPILEPYDWKTLRNEMLNIRVRYLEATEWKDKPIDPALLANKKLRNIVECIKIFSPYWGTLGDIFNRYKKPGLMYDTAEDVKLESRNLDSNLCDSNDGELILKYEPADPQFSPMQGSSDVTTAFLNTSTLRTQTMRQNIIEATQTATHNEDASNRNESIDENLEFIKLEPGSPQPSTSQTSYDFKQSGFENAQQLQNLLLIKEQNLVMGKEKTELEREKLKMEREKLELEKEKVRNDFELKKLALQNELELKKLEIALRVEADERLRKYEIDLKYS